LHGALSPSVSPPPPSARRELCSKPLCAHLPQPAGDRTVLLEQPPPSAHQPQSMHACASATVSLLLSTSPPPRSLPLSPFTPTGCRPPARLGPCSLADTRCRPNQPLPILGPLRNLGSETRMNGVVWWETHPVLPPPLASPSTLFTSTSKDCVKKIVKSHTEAIPPTPWGWGAARRMGPTLKIFLLGEPGQSSTLCIRPPLRTGMATERLP